MLILLTLLLFIYVGTPDDVNADESPMLADLQFDLGLLKREVRRMSTELTNERTRSDKLQRQVDSLIGASRTGLPTGTEEVHEKIRELENAISNLDSQTAVDDTQVRVLLNYMHGIKRYIKDLKSAFGQIQITSVELQKDSVRLQQVVRGLNESNVETVETITAHVRDAMATVQTLDTLVSNRVGAEIQSMTDSLQQCFESIQLLNTSLQRKADAKTALLAGLMGKECVHDQQCYIDYSECRDGACWCEAGLSFDPNTGSCVTTCDQYGDTFQVVLDHYIRGHNVNETSGLSLEECMDSCINSVDFSCRSFDYNNDTFCYLASLTATEVPGRVWAASRRPDFVAYYQRDCFQIV